MKQKVKSLVSKRQVDNVIDLADKNREKISHYNNRLHNLGFIKSTRQPTTGHLATDSPTHRPPNHQTSDAITILKRLKNSNIFTSQNTKTAVKM